jgi:DUF1680 family protein
VIERRPSDHVHGYLTSLRGVMDLYGATGDSRFLQQCEAAWTDVTQSPDLLITGGVPEGWSPNGHRTEGCAEADWVRLNLALYKWTGNRKYIAMAERAIFNELAFNQFATGDFGHRLYSETGLPGNGAVRAWWCCTLHGLRAFPDIHASVFDITHGGHYLRPDRFQDGPGGIWFNLPVDGRMSTGILSIESASSLAENGTVRITMNPAHEEALALRIRKPDWADALEVHVNGRAGEFPLEEGYVHIERAWATGDTVEIRYAMQLRREPAGDNRVSYWYGPWLLGAPASGNPAYFNELTDQNRLMRGQERSLMPGKEQPASAAAQPLQAFAVPIAATAAPFIHAEYADQPQTVTLRAIAEQTGQPTTSWMLRFLTAEKS